MKEGMGRDSRSSFPAPSSSASALLSSSRSLRSRPIGIAEQFYPVSARLLGCKLCPFIGLHVSCDPFVCCAPPDLDNDVRLGSSDVFRPIVVCASVKTMTLSSVIYLYEAFTVPLRERRILRRRPSGCSPCPMVQAMGIEYIQLGIKYLNIFYTGGHV